jgi:hypothetical protein
MPEQPPLDAPWQAYWLAKRGHRPDEYEDAFAGDGLSGRFALADGATESSFAASWAKLLVAGFVRGAGGPNAGAGWLETLRQRWAAEVDPKPLPWYAEIKRQEGAFATLLGLTVKRAGGKGGGPWRAQAVGDTCLFQISRGRLARAFPLARSADFGNCPSLLGSRQAQQGPPKKARGRWRAGDRFYLMTDALAQWFLARHEARARPWQAIDTVLAEPATGKAFAAWVEGLRDHGGLRNDDVTLLTVAL